ncbi:probable LRR receptor-like serine/threonine-protein kinase At1g07650 isoform X3 [Jatropha curcas]|uniref:probable LRR receptor-like serine/threonine-protein kinase At1g07650 isoform X3 n=1 Tax=Jatropha curcas TaxID=180498 RepID=UPI001894A44E|nr:probable LRR receptor-like serine/threonine-protein kinase At1g07650 isoform X3 [Jatropha curcas]
MRTHLASPKLLLIPIICSISFFSFLSFGFAATAKLHPSEVKVLKDIAKKLGKKDWDFGKDPCSGEGNWRVLDERKGFESSVYCNCSFNNNTTCRVVSIALKAQNLSGTIPPEFSKLRHLQLLDLSRNCFTGSIPSQWATLRLVNLSFMGNRLSGSFPKVLTNITTLTNLSVEGNRFSGSIPREIGKLINLQKFILSSNAFTGKLPTELSKLTNLTDMRISDNNFSGTIPTFINKWTHIQKLHIQGSGLEGPIPSSISALKNLSDLRISDLKGKGSTFPPLSNMESIKALILRNCLLSDEIPEYIGHMKKLKNLDLSFNNLTGEIPTSFSYLGKADFMYLTGNKLTGSVPEWVLERNKNVDISDNNFSWESSSPIECPRGSVNLVESYSSSTEKLSKVHSCLKQNFPCSSNKKYYSLYINCGGEEMIAGEIVFINDSSFNSLGRRIFDVYIQEKLVLKDFNIVEEAGGTGRPIVKKFTVTVTSHTLKIHFYWAGKGTTGIPVRGTYGPLISAISVDPNFKPPSDNDEKEKIIVSSTVAGAVFLVLLVLCIMWRKGCLGGKVYADKELRGLDLQTGIFTLKQIKAATKNFDAANKVGEGGFGSVYKGQLSDGTIIAVKQLSSKSKQGNREFVNEIGMISALQHPNLVKLYGCCVEGNQLLLIYEYMENNCLSRALFGKNPTSRLKLDWPTRQKICLGVARGLAYLHEESIIKIVHRDIKTSNVLIDKDLNAKISDFGLAKLNEDDNTHISTRVAGTM